MSTIISLVEAADSLAQLVAKALAGEEIIISIGEDRVRLVRDEEAPREARQLGGLKGRMLIADSFDAPNTAMLRQIGI